MLWGCWRGHRAFHVYQGLSAVMEHLPNATWEEKAYFTLCFQVTVHYWGKSGQELKAGTWGRKVFHGRGHERMLLTSVFFMTCSVYFLRQLRTMQPGVALPTVGWAFQPSSLIKKRPYRLTYRQSDRLIFSTGFLLLNNSSLCQVGRKLTRTAEKWFRESSIIS